MSHLNLAQLQGLSGLGRKPAKKLGLKKAQKRLERVEAKIAKKGTTNKLVRREAALEKRITHLTRPKEKGSPPPPDITRDPPPPPDDSGGNVYQDPYAGGGGGGGGYSFTDPSSSTGSGWDDVSLAPNAGDGSQATIGPDGQVVTDDGTGSVGMDPKKIALVAAAGVAVWWYLKKRKGGRR